MCFQDLTSGLLERSQIDEKYKWDTGDVYPDSKAWAADYLWVESQLPAYASSFSAAVQIASDIVSEGDPARERFVDFLKTGNSEYAVESLKKAGVDITSIYPYEAVAKRMNDLMDEMERILRPF